MIARVMFIGDFDELSKTYIVSLTTNEDQVDNSKIKVDDEVILVSANDNEDGNSKQVTNVS